MSSLVCWNCGHGLDDVPRPISRHATCARCFNELHCCRLCRHYDPKRTLQCFEDRADPPLQKENANFCDFFAPQSGAFQVQTSDRSDIAKNELNALFDQDNESVDEGAPSTTISDEPLSQEAEARRKLNDLFD